MNGKGPAYPPLDTLKPVAGDLWIVDSVKPMAFGMTLPVRMTVIRLPDGTLLLHSPTRYAIPLRQELEAIGPIRHLVAPSFAHWMFMAPWVAPDTTTWAVPGLRDRSPLRRSGLRLDRDLGDTPPAEWGGAIETCVIRGGGGFREVAFLHRPSRTVVLTDLVLNLEPATLPLAGRAFARMVGIAAPDGRAPVYLRALVRLRHREAAEAAARVLAWEPERVIFAHGSWFDHDGEAALRRSWRWLLE